MKGYRAYFLLDRAPRWSVREGDHVHVFAEGPGTIVVLIRQERRGADTESMEDVIDVLRGRERVVGTVRVRVAPDATGIYAEIYAHGRHGLERVWRMPRTVPPRLAVERPEVLVEG
ncbi:MAG: hypothetical protein QXP81_09115 [Nitrososphaerota archaeon]